MIFQDGYCEKCDKKYTNEDYKWCKPCQINSIIRNFANSENEKVDLIQKMQQKINHPLDIIFEWIPYNQFSNIKKIVNNNFDIVYSAVWKDGPLNYNKDLMNYVRSQENQCNFVTLKYLYGFSQNITDELV
jgi:hypothetical protein